LTFNIEEHTRGKKGEEGNEDNFLSRGLPPFGATGTSERKMTSAARTTNSAEGKKKKKKKGEGRSAGFFPSWIRSERREKKIKPSSSISIDAPGGKRKREERLQKRVRTLPFVRCFQEEKGKKKRKKGIPLTSGAKQHPQRKKKKKKGGKGLARAHHLPAV